MKCLSCEVEINPKWTFAISQNVCPMCGDPILEEKLKDLLTSLREITDALQEYPEQLNDWMFSNLNYIKTDSPNLVDFVPEDMLKGSKVSKNKYTIKTSDGKTEEVVAEKILSEDQTSDFFKRAKAIKRGESSESLSDKTQYYKSMAEKIRKEVSTGAVNMGITASMLENADDDAVAEFQQAMSGGEDYQNSNEYDSDGEDEIPSFILNMAPKNASDNKASDLIKLQQMQDKVKQSRAAFKNGSGGFSR